MIEPDDEQNAMPIARKRTHRRNNHLIKGDEKSPESKMNRLKTIYGVAGKRN